MRRYGTVYLTFRKSSLLSIFQATTCVVSHFTTYDFSHLRKSFSLLNRLMLIKFLSFTFFLTHKLIRFLRLRALHVWILWNRNTNYQNITFSTPIMNVSFKVFGNKLKKINCQDQVNKAILVKKWLETIVAYSYQNIMDTMFGCCIKW